MARGLAPVLVAGLTLTAFLPALSNDFVRFDDHIGLLDNPAFRGFGREHLRWMWTSTTLATYQPVVWMTWALDYLVWGLDPRGYHLTNLVLHTASAVLVYGLTLRLLVAAHGKGSADESPGSRLGAAVAALFFGIHPLRAEPVAWVSGRADLVAGLFLLVSVLVYLEAWRRDATGGRAAGWLSAALGAFAVSLLAKPVGLAYPLVLVVLDVYPLRRLGRGAGGRRAPAAWRVWREKLPFAALSLAIAPVTLLARARPGSWMEWQPLEGTALAAYGLAFYLWKTFFLGPLSPLYERPMALNALDGRFVVSAVAVLGITGLLVARRARWPAALAAWVSYVAMLAPRSEFVPFGSHIAADRYTYLPSLGWAVLVGACVREGWARWRAGWVRPAAGTVAAALVVASLAGLGALTWSQVQVWRDTKTLWTHVLSVDPASGVAHNNLGYILETEGRFAEAVAHYWRATQARPGDSRPALNLGRALVLRGRELGGQGQFAEAVDHYRAALRVRPGYRDAETELAAALRRLGDMPPARSP